jgi:hypothetical protein
MRGPMSLRSSSPRTSDDRDAEESALQIVRSVGEVGGVLLATDSGAKLVWSRANLIVELERYVAAAERR